MQRIVQASPPEEIVRLATRFGDAPMLLCLGGPTVGAPCCGGEKPFSATLWEDGG